MSDENMLSQEEVDALLNATSDNQTEEQGADLNDYLSGVESDALGEIGNISFGSAATTLSTLLSQKVAITTPSLSVVKQSELKNEFPHPYVAVVVKYTKGFQGSNALIIKEKDARIIADLMLGGDGTNPGEEIGEMESSAVQEAMNQMIGSASTSMSTVFNKVVDISPPVIDMMDIPREKGTEVIPGDDPLIKVSFNLKVGDLIDSDIMQLLPVGFAKELVEDLLNPGVKEEEIKAFAAKEKEAFSEQTVQESNAKTGMNISENKSAGAEVNETPQRKDTAWNDRKANIQSAAFADFKDGDNDIGTVSRNLNMLYDIPLGVTVELGRTSRTVKDILSLTQGSVIELDKLAGEPVDILVNHKLIAKGEVVVIDESFGVRITEISNTEDRIQKLS
jgi:flagellar motor switch protein FliN/FliY